MAKATVRMALAALVMWLYPAAASAEEPFWMGVNVKESSNAQWGSDAAQDSMNRLAASGATKAMLVAFTWQAEPSSSNPVIGSDSSPEHIRQGLRQMKQAGLQAVLKVHLWIPDHWAGDAEPEDRKAWFQAYEEAVMEYARLAAQEELPALIIGTELRGLESSAYWPNLVAAVRRVYDGKVLYVANSLERAERFRYWSLFDAVASSLYPSLSEHPEERGAQMQAAAECLVALGERHSRPVWVAELGARSAEGSLTAPWESPEQRDLPVDMDIQRDILQAWLGALRQTGIEGLAIWCWYTDPEAGGEQDTDFTIQNKPAQAVLKQE
ncbi:glycoside hydrolase family 113 [Pseudomonas sp.]|uniref:glycoside hydrolase family 113 n=1 Tax=Pseudomonas sp. TaxID=306 RepID=UPI00272A2A16|nr:hypothetical protein [Pseudomonas sp.]